MGLFTKNYSKPGPGVDKDAPQKNAFFKFFELFWRKFFMYVALNLLYMLTILPIIVMVYLNVYGNMFVIVGMATEDIILTPMLESCVLLYNMVPNVLHIPLLILSLLIYGPMTMGMTYVLRNYSREEHAWISDLFTKAKQNFFQGVFFGLLDIIVFFIIYFNWTYGFLWSNDSTAVMLATVARWVSLVVAVLYLFMRNYCYQLAVTVRLKISQILRNASIFAVLGLLRNIAATVCMLALFILSTLINPLLEMVMVPLLTFSLCGFVAVYATYPITHKHLVQPALDAEKKQEDDIPEAILPPELGGPGAGSLGIDDFKDKD